LPSPGGEHSVLAVGGDMNSYFLAPGGAFDGGSSWTLSGARLTPGNGPFYLNGSGDSQSLTISA
jgi:hypothetical protein